MGKTKLILAVSYVLVLTAGGACGWVFSQDKKPRPARSWLTRELDLTPGQQEQMRLIWSRHVSDPNSRGPERRRALAAERDQAIQNLLTDEQKANFSQIQQDYENKLKEMAQERKAAWEESVRLTRAILTPEQAQKYDELLKRQQERGERGERGGSERFGHSRERRERMNEEKSAHGGSEK